MWRGNQPSSFWLLDRRGAVAALDPIIQNYASLDPQRVAPVREVSYAARDGLKIPAFLTLPLGYKGGTIPFVVLPHGGPTAHDSGKFDFLAQYIASRGYGVLQPQFRGSTGYGDEFERAGFQQWGRAMQDDVTDGTRWLAAQGYADPHRICIVGASYGGYAALMGAAKEPELYHCAVALAPVTDLTTFEDDMKSFAFSDLNTPGIAGSKQPLDDISPAQQAARIQIPLLLVHGRKDYTVPVSQSEKMERALNSANKPVEAVYLDNADHYLSRGQDRVEFLRRLGAFLDRQLKAPEAQGTCSSPKAGSKPVACS